MTRRRLVLVIARCSVGILACSAMLAAPAAATPRPAHLGLHLRWRLVTRGALAVASNDRYVAIVKGFGASARITLIDEQTRTRRTLLPPTCPALDDEGAPMFGGPWLMVSCAPDASELYDTTSAQWVSFVTSPQCGNTPYQGPGLCGVVGVGRRWVKLETTGGCAEHCQTYYYLQNIATGQLKPDPITAGGRVLDDLDAPSGVVALCAPLRYATRYADDILALVPGTLQFSGRYALASEGVPSQNGGATTYRLEACGSRHVIDVANASLQFPPLMSSRAVVSLGARKYHCHNSPTGLTCATHYYIRGIYLRGLREFAAALPKAAGSQTSGEIVGVTRLTVYVQAPYPGGSLWAAALPPPPTARGHQ